VPQIQNLAVGRATTVERLAEKSEAANRMNAMEGGYGIWLGQPVVLRVLAGNIRVPLRGRLVAETRDAVRLRIDESWDVDIFKSMILGVEHDTPVYVLN
jgi:hypothetical protein